MLCEIKERTENDERIYELTIEEKTVCSAKTLGYGILENIITTEHERRKHYGTKLLQHIEELTRQNEVTVMKTTNIDSKDTAAVSFFRKMGYRLEPTKTDDQFLEGSKELVSKQVKGPTDPRLIILSYLLEFRDYSVREKYPRVSLKYIAEECNLSVWPASRILEKLRTEGLVERSFGRNVPPEEQFFQITSKGIRYLIKNDEFLQGRDI